MKEAGALRISPAREETVRASAIMPSIPSAMTCMKSFCPGCWMRSISSATSSGVLPEPVMMVAELVAAP